MFKVRFDFDYEEFKRNASYREQGTKPFQFTPEERLAITRACGMLRVMSQRATVSDRLRNRLLDEYFHTHDDATLVLNLTLLNDKIQDQSRTVTFVDGTNLHVAVKVDPQNIDGPQRPMAPMTDEQMAGAGAWVHTLPGTGVPYSLRERHVGSGYRIILGPAWSRLATHFERAGTIYHELSHKIVGTNDHAYGERECKLLELDRAIKNADNYNYFLQELGVRAQIRWVS